MKLLLMRTTLLVVLSLLFVCSSVQAEDYDSFNTRLGESGYSPAVHYGIGAFTGIVTYVVIPDEWNVDPVLKALVGICASLVVGATIEMFDDKFDSRDFIDYGVGAAVGIGAFEIIKITF